VQLTPEDRQRIIEQELARAKALRQAERNTRLKYVAWACLGGLGLIIIVAMAAVVLSSAYPSGLAAEKTSIGGMPMLAEILLVVNLILLMVLIYLFLKRGGVQPQEVESAVSSAWLSLGLDEKVGRLGSYAEDIREDYRSLEQMLRVPTERASLGEMALEKILSDQLPQDMFGIRKRILSGLVPDAHIESTVGAICIDSKFPLANYRLMVEASGDEKDKCKRRFLRDIKGHLDKIANDYVCPEKGSSEFAFAYIQSEGVYWFLVNEGYDLLRDYAKRGVQVVSPLTLTHKIELIKAGVHARKLSQEARRVSADLMRLSDAFQAIDDKWATFYGTHLRNLRKKADEVDLAYTTLRDEFGRVARLD
jgi:DNA recombination protein RmuC